MDLKENVKLYDQKLKEISEKKEQIDDYKKEYEEKVSGLISDVKKLEEEVKTTFIDIEKEIKDRFEKDKSVKKFYGGFGIQERKVYTYDEKTALNWAKEKDMFLLLDIKSFEKALDGLDLDFVKKDTEKKVTIPKEIKLEG